MRFSDTSIPFSGLSLLLILISTSTAALAQTENEANALTEVVVTAQKRAENIQDIPLSVTAITGGELQRQGVVDVQSLQSIVPGVQVSNGALGAQINIRGVTSTNSTEVGDPAVAFHVDGVYTGRPRATAGTFFDVDRVEVLRGPQGTLYGRNATAGSVNVITKQPTDQFEASGALEAGNYALFSATGVLNVPLSSAVAMRGAFQTYKHDGYTNNSPSPDGNDADSVAGRLHLLMNPTESLSILVSGDIFRNEGVGLKDRPIPVAGDLYTFPIDNAAGNPRTDQKQKGGSATVDWDLGFGTFTYIGAYRDDELSTFGASSTSSTPADVTLEQNQQSHELRLSGETGALKWLGGVFYYDEDQSVNVLIPQGAISLGFIQDPVKAKSKAVFTQATYSLREDLRITGGLRYSEDQKSRLGGVYVNGALVSPNIASDNWDATNYRLAVDWDVTPSSLLYGSVTSGYKAGGYIDGVPPNSYGPEHLTAFELGSKNRFVNQRLQLNASVFYYDYKDYQVTYTGLLFPDNPNSPVISRTSNAKKATSYGTEGELVFVATPTDRLNANLSLLHAEYDDLTLQFVDLFGNIDYSGNRMVGAPDVSGNVGYEHTWLLAGRGEFLLRGQAQYTSAKDLDYRNFALTRQDAVTTLNANFIYTAESQRWTIELWGRNLTDEEYLISAAPSTNPPNANAGTGVLGVPRTYGLRFSAHF